MTYTRRDIGRLAVASLPVAGLMGAPKPNSVFGGVRIGAITYSFRALPGSAEETLKYCLECGISQIELMGDVAERYAGAPAAPSFGPPPAGPRQPPTPEQQEARRKYNEELKAWRTSVSMDKFKAFRKMYNNAGVTMYAFKIPPLMQMSDAEYEYIWNAAETVGANHITMELPTSDEHLKRVADYAAKRKLAIAFHTHGQGGASGFDKALAASKYTMLNFDVGHYYGVTGESPVPLVVKYHDRIASLHLKDRGAPPAGGGTNPQRGGPTTPWGEGGTPLRELLQTMKKNKYKFPGSIEYEYRTPEGSDVLTEVKKCVEFCKSALA